MRDGARRRVVRVGTAQSVGLQEADSARRRAAKGKQRKAPGCERGTAQGAKLRAGNSARRQSARAEQRTEA
eukprot:6212551-Pleurochrysis_carterae.AAC.1